MLSNTSCSALLAVADQRVIFNASGQGRQYRSAGADANPPRAIGSMPANTSCAPLCMRHGVRRVEQIVLHAIICLGIRLETEIQWLQWYVALGNRFRNRQLETKPTSP